MAFWNDMQDTLRNIFEEGLDEVLIFAVIFIFVLLSGKDSDCGDSPGILPIIIIAAFLLLFANTCRTEESAG